MKKEIYNGVEYHFPEYFKNAKEYLENQTETALDDATIREMQFSDIRSKRNKLLLETDWTQLADCQLNQEKKAEFIKYRQQLRDLPQNIESARSFDFDKIIWPQNPSLKKQTL